MEHLSIAIPTYNRSFHLKKRLEELMPQLNNKPDHSLVVFDNASQDQTEPLCREIRHPQFKYIRNRFNMGICRNIIRCLEDVNSEWVWILGDDDPVKPNALDLVEKAINESASGVIQFDSIGGKILKNRVLNDLEEVYRYHDPIRSMFISGQVFNRFKLQKHLGILGPAAFTYAPHLALIMRMLEMKTASLELRTESPLYPAITEKTWSTMEGAIGISLMPEFVKSPVLQRLAARHFRIDSGWKLVYALREVRTLEEAHRWKRIANQVYKTLGNYGAGSLGLSSKYRKPTMTERKDYWITLFGRMIPSRVLLQVCSIMRRKHPIEPSEVVGDFK